MGLDVAVQHRDIGSHAEAVRDPMNVEIPVRAALVMADLPANALGENLGAATRQRIEAGLDQLAQDPLVTHAIQVRKKRYLHGRETLQMNARSDALEALKQLGVIAER